MYTTCKNQGDLALGPNTAGFLRILSVVTDRLACAPITRPEPVQEHTPAPCAGGVGGTSLLGLAPPRRLLPTRTRTPGCLPPRRRRRRKGPAGGRAISRTRRVGIEVSFNVAAHGAALVLHPLRVPAGRWFTTKGSTYPRGKCAEMAPGRITVDFLFFTQLAIVSWPRTERSS